MKQKIVTLVALLALALGMFVTATSAGAQSAEDDPAQVEAGMAVFEANCAGCHSSDGSGSTTGRPLIGVAAEQPDRLVHIESVTNGKGQGMPAFGENLSAEEIDSAVSYVRLTFVAEEAEAEGAAELAQTGVNSLEIAFVGTTVLLAGLLILWQLRREPYLR